MASTVILLSLLLLITCSSFMPSKSHSIDPTNDGFSISVIHRDSPQSPLYNHSMTPYETHIAQLRRSISRVKHLSLRASAASRPNNNPPSTSTKIFYDLKSEEYIASYVIGTPRTKVYAFVDTGSDIIWTKGQAFNTSLSSTYEPLSCNSSTCQLLGDDKNCRDGPCTYKITYADQTTTSGVFSHDNFSFGPPGKWLEVGFLNFGVSNASSSDFKGKLDGCLGLNRGPLSFISQLGIKRFSHCFVPPDKGSGSGSTLSFGSRAVIRSRNLTPFAQSASRLWHYYVNLQGISIGSTQVQIPPGTFNITPSGDGFVVDSGTPNTLLTETAYDPFLNLMRRFLPKHLVLYRDHGRDCFNGTQKDLDSVPLVTFHFAGGVDVKLTKERTFVKSGDQAWCLAIAKSPVGKLSIFGSIQMANLNVGYDLVRNGISFTQADCSASTSGGA